MSGKVADTDTCAKRNEAALKMRKGGKRPSPDQPKAGSAPFGDPKPSTSNEDRHCQWLDEAGGHLGEMQKGPQWSANWPRWLINDWIIYYHCFIWRNFRAPTWSIWTGIGWWFPEWIARSGKNIKGNKATQNTRHLAAQSAAFHMLSPLSFYEKEWGSHRIIPNLKKIKEFAVSCRFKMEILRKGQANSMPWLCQHPMMTECHCGFSEGQFQLSETSYMQIDKDWICLNYCLN